MSIILPLPVSVGDGISISGTVTVNVANTPNVVVANTSPIGVNVANTPNVNVANSSPIPVNVANTVSVSQAAQQLSLKIITGTTSATAGALTQLTTTSTLAHAFIVVSGSSSNGVDVYATNNNKALLGYAIGPSGANARVVYYNFGNNVVDLSTIYITGDGTATSVPYTVIYW